MAVTRDEIREWTIIEVQCRCIRLLLLELKNEVNEKHGLRGLVLIVNEIFHSAYLRCIIALRAKSIEYNVGKSREIL